MPPRKVAKAGEKRKIATVEIDWEADREAEDVPGLLRELGKKLKTDTDESEKWKSGFPKRDYKACPDHLNKVADKLAKQFDSRAELEKTNEKLLEEIAELKRTIADHEASVPKPPKDPTKKTKPGPIPHHLQTLITNTTRATEQGHFRWESHVDLLVGNLLTHCFPLDHGFFVGAQQTFMTGTAADDEMIDIMNSWSVCVEPLDTTRTTYNDRASLADSTRELDSTEAPGSIGVPGSPTASSHEVGPMTSTPRPQKDAFFPEDELQGEFWDDLSVDSINFPAEPDLTNTSPHPNATISPSSSLSAVPIAAASTTLQVPSSDVSVLNASPLPTVHGRPSSQSGPAQVWDNVNDLFPNRTAPNLAYAPPPPILISPPADPSSSSLAAPVAAAPITSQMLPSGSHTNPVVHDGSVPVTVPLSPGIEPDLSQHEIPSFEGQMPEMPLLREVLKDPPSDLGIWHVVDDAGRCIFNKSGRVKIKRPDFRVSFLESEVHQIWKNLVVVEDKLRASTSAVEQLLSYMEDLEEGGGNHFALGLAVVFNTHSELKVAMFRRNEENGPIKNIGGTYEHRDGNSCVQFKWYYLNSAEVRDQLLVIWQDEMEARGLHEGQC